MTVRRVLNPHWQNRVLAYLWGYLLIVVGAALTFCVQSSSVFTSTLTPLVGIGLLEVETVYPLFLGSNIGTTSTGMLSALATTGSRDNLQDALTIAFVHLFFNVFGILLFYPVPFMRVPIPLCKMLGNTTARYRWFALAYLAVMFVLLPAFVMILSLNSVVFASVVTPLGILLVFVVAVNFAQRKEKLAAHLPEVLRDWEFLPRPLHSLGYWDEYDTSDIVTIQTCPNHDQTFLKETRLLRLLRQVSHHERRGGGQSPVRVPKRPGEHRPRLLLLQQEDERGFAVRRH